MATKKDDAEGLQELKPGSAKRGRQYEHIIDKYRVAHPGEDGGSIEPHRIAEWAVKTGIYKRPPMSPEEILRRELSKFLKGEHIIDPQNREVRKNHAVFVQVSTSTGVRRVSRWFPLFEAPEKHIKASFQLRRRAAVADVVQLELDFQSYNDNNIYGVTLTPMDFDLNKDIEESKQPTRYAPDVTEDEDDEI